MFDRIDAFIYRLPLFARVALVSAVGVGVLKVAENFNNAASQTPHIYRMINPDITRAMESLMRGVNNAKDAKPVHLPDIPGRDFI